MLEYVDNKTRCILLYALFVMTLLLVGVELPIYIRLALVVSSYIAIAYKTVIGAFKTLIKRRRMSEEFLMSIATFGALGLQDYPEALAILIFYRIGSIFEDYAQGRSHKEITTLLSLKPDFVRVIDEEGKETKVKPRKVKVGTTIRVLAGDVVGIDGVLLSESASLDTSALTGESEPVMYKKGDTISSGCINLGAVIELRSSVESKNSSISRLINLIEDAAASKSKPEALITRFSIYYTPIVVSIAAILAIAPFIFDGLDYKDWFTRALVFLVLSCPCALVLSVPLSFFGGLGAISKIGVMVKGSVHIESLSKLKAIAFDKTGTITYGKFTIGKIKTQAGVEESALLSYLYTLESMTTHPIGNAIVNYCKEHEIKKLNVSDVKEIAGFGLTGLVDGKELYVGRREFIENKLNIKITHDEANKDNHLDFGTMVYASFDNKYLGYVMLFDREKDEAKSFFERLNGLNIESFMITGDRESVASYIAKKLNIKHYFAKQLPEDKLNTFNGLKAKYGKVAYVGDGINDAPVLAASDVGIAMGQFGSAQALEVSDVVVMTDNLSKIADAIDLSKKTVKLAISNMVLVIGVKLLILILGALGIANIWLAILGDVGLCIIAVLNAMRALTWVK